MTLSSDRKRPLGTMIAYGFSGHRLADDLLLARQLGATLVEALPDWRSVPDPVALARELNAVGLRPFSVHACWGRQSIRASRVDLAATDRAIHAASIDDLLRCLDWASLLGALVVVIHPGGFSEQNEAPARSAQLCLGLTRLAEHLSGSSLKLGVENMPPGVHPGSSMIDIRSIIETLDRPEVGLVVDTGHAHMVSTCQTETTDADRWLLSTHVHDNERRADSHLVPGAGTIDWDAWISSLDRIGYEGPIMLECIRELRRAPGQIKPGLLKLLDRLTGREGGELSEHP